MATEPKNNAVPDDNQKEFIERAKLLFDYQQKQYEFALASLRRLEDKAAKIFGSINIMITITFILVKYLESIIFAEENTPPAILCWIALALFFILFLISWGFTFSAMQPREGLRPPTDSSVIGFFMDNPRQNALSAFANSYVGFIEHVDSIHKEKVKLIQNAAEAMLFGAWAFVAFLIFFLITKFS
ncbi:hypothetical protein [Kosakonia cowanii]|uniref:hypothetical protein n=1 Tax=Kosakonia cowanii TaxID=208223 RepID=UPI0021E95C1F|nr:hypothetical protein [Kosakonia cowanii]